MNWRHVQLIFTREMRDQLRDRRTLFTIVVLPLLLYPLMGMMMMQVAQFSREHVVRVRIIGLEHWTREVPLVDRDLNLISRPGAKALVELVKFSSQPWPSGTLDNQSVLSQARHAVEQNEVDAVLVVAPTFESALAERLTTSNDSIADESPDAKQPLPVQAPAALEDPSTDHGNQRIAEGLHVVANHARDQSEIALQRVDALLKAWQQAWIAKQLVTAGVNPRLMDPIDIRETDTSVAAVRHAMLWSKILPFVMLVWALTGAFYPAIDLCAGEKERGTLETLLSSPARRREIVWGKLLTVFSFSVGSALLNLFSMHLTASFIVRQLAAQGSAHVASALGPMPIHAIGWLVLLLLPMAAFFSALAFAVAALARSTKEGQYYLMPLLLFAIPLVALPMIPSLGLNMGTSLVPVSGAIFLVRALIEGRYADALIHFPLVTGVTGICCLLAVRWAVRQFESESVMFRESDHWTFRIWVSSLWRSRESTASTAEAVLCGLIILVALFFAQFVSGTSTLDWNYLAKSAVSTQLGIILTPSLLMAIFLTTSLRKSLRLHRVPIVQLAAAVVLGIALHPSYTLLGEAVSNAFEISKQTREILQGVSSLIGSQPLWIVLLMLAVLPAVCEELTYRGFIFGGLLRKDGALRAVLVSSIFFGLSHTVLQQSISATVMGLLLGIVAWRTGSVLCTMVIHCVNNTLSLSLAWLSLNDLQLPSSTSWAVDLQDGQWHYQPTWITLSIGVAIIMLVILFRRDSVAQQIAQAEMA